MRPEGQLAYPSGSVTMHGMTLFDGYQIVRSYQEQEGSQHTTNTRTILSSVHVGFVASGAMDMQLSSAIPAPGVDPPQMRIWIGSV